ncbi:ABC-three component system middle component 2 [Hydrocarboniphaga effusa]|uniref:ABC-three component system middle component 2 n=1 Tax=Hydrocarboniphaga effusa TaxID=243629 RepID=UPI0035AE35B7
MNNSRSPFNSALEVGLRALTLLAALCPRSIDLQTLVELDYLMIHSSDANGPESLHPPLPLRSGELLVRREVLQGGVLLMISRGLVLRESTERGFSYSATDAAQPVLDALESRYVRSLRARAEWVSEAFGSMSAAELARVTSNFYQRWTAQFQLAEQAYQ